MSEAEFTVFQNITIVLQIFIYAASLAYFFYPFMTRKREPVRSRKRKVLIVFVGYSLIYLAGLVFPIWNWLCMILTYVILAAASKYLDMDRNVCLLLMIFFMCIKNLSRLISESPYHILTEKIVSGNTRAELILRNAAVAYVVYIVVSLSILIAMLYFLRKRISDSITALNIKEICYLGLIPVTGALFVDVIHRVFITIQGNEVFQLYMQYPIFLGIVPLIAVLFYAGIIITVMSYQQMVMLQKEKEEYFVEEQQLHSLQERTHEVEQFYTGIRQFRHEIRNHLTNIKGLAESGKYEDMEQYIAKMDDSLSVFELIVKTGNSITDVIVNDKKKAADKLGIKFQTEFIYPQSSKYNAYDVGIILNNLLTNALEACEKMNGKERYIILSGRQKRKFFLIEVKNSFVGEIEFDKNTDLPVSTKQNDNSLHGIGLSNVKREVEKYMGDVKIKIKKNEFGVTVLLQERSNDNE